jgi:hypothetical protein
LIHPVNPASYRASPALSFSFSKVGMTTAPTSRVLSEVSMRQHIKSTYNSAWHIDVHFCFCFFFPVVLGLEL